jgi:Na+/H+ antiporter NhaA/protein-disulfide isomerase
MCSGGVGNVAYPCDLVAVVVRDDAGGDGMAVSGAVEARTYGGRTAWARNLGAPVRDFLSTQTGGAGVMALATVAALVWANSPWWHSYESVWSTTLAVRIGGAGVTADFRVWVNEGLMSVFFLVVGLEAKREFDLGVPVAIYFAFNAGGAGAHGWGAAMSSDSAFTLGVLALLTPRSATRLRVFLLTLSVVDDVCALLVIAIVYTAHVSWIALAVAVGLFGVLVGLRRARVALTPLSVAVAVALWVAMFESGIDPVISGLAVGLVTGAYAPARADLERGVALAYSFREQPTPELARSARVGLLSAISPNERLQYALHPWASYVIVPLFALANAGVHVTGTLLGDAIASPVTLGILLGYVIGKPVGISVGSWLATRPALHGPRSPLTPPMVVAGGACAGIGFTVSLLISSLAFHGRLLNEAKLGALGSVILAPLVAWGVLSVIRHLPTSVRLRQLGRTADDILDLAEDVDPARDHIRGSDDAPVTLVEYGDFECTYCGQAEQVIRELLSEQGDDVRYVWRHLPLNDVHPNAQLAAEASEAAAAQGRFWEMHDVLLAHQGALRLADIASYARELGLDSDRLVDEVRRGEYRDRVSEDVSSADESEVSGTPTFFINGRRHYGVYDTVALTEAVGTAKRRAYAVTS